MTVDFNAPDIDYAAISPQIALMAGICAVLLVSVLGKATNRNLVTSTSLLGLGSALGLMIWQSDRNTDLVAGALRLDGLAASAAIICIGVAIYAALLGVGEPAFFENGQSRHGEFNALLLTSVLGMVQLASAQNLVALFIALELLSIPLYVMSGFARGRRESLESGLKYLIVGSLGSATVLYGSAFIYGGSGSTDFGAIAAALGDGGLASDPLIGIGIALLTVGLAFKVSIAPFHQWTPDVYQGAPTTVTGFMAVATKVAAFAVFVRLFEVALGPAASNWQPALAALAALSILVGNLGALGQSSLKRLLGWSGVAQGGYMLVGLLVASEVGVNALIFYLAGYALMNLAAFSVIAIRERESNLGDSLSAVEGLGGERPALAWALTISMLALAGLPGTVGFFGKLYLIEAAVDGEYTWLGIVIVIGSMISLGYYLRVIAAIWMRSAPDPASLATSALGPIDGGSPEGEREASGSRLLIVPLALVAAAAVFFGILPDPLVDFAKDAGRDLIATVK